MLLKNNAKVLVVGGGIAGLSLSFILEKSGIPVDLIERNSQLVAENAGVLLNSQTLEILASLGIREEIESLGRVYRTAKIFNQNNKCLATLELSRISEEFGQTVAVARGDLHSHFKSHINPEKLKLNTSLHSLKYFEDGVEVEFDNHEKSQYSLVVGADGPQSRVRSLLFGSRRAKFVGYWCWQWITDEIETDQPDTLCEYWGKGLRLGIVPLINNKTYVYAFFNASRKFNLPKRDWISSIKKQFAEFAEPVTKLLKDSMPFENLTLTPVLNVELKKWQKDRVVLIGEAAHALSPNLGQGAATAIRDSSHLAQTLHFGTSWVQAAQKFEWERKPRVKRIQRYAHWLGKIAQVEGNNVARLRNAIIRLIPNKILLKIASKAFL